MVKQPTFTIRPYHSKDRDTVVALLTLCLTYDKMDDTIFADRILLDPDFLPDLNIVISAKNRVVAFAAGAPANRHLQCPGGIKLFAVAPDWQQRRLASHLFDELETRLRTMGAGRAVAMAAGNNRLTQGLDVRYTAALCFLSERGYEKTGVAQDMVVDLAQADFDTRREEADAFVDGVVFRQATAADRCWLHEGVARELEYPTPRAKLGKRWAYLATLALDSQPGRVQVAEEVATGAFLGFGATQVARWGVLGPMGIAERVRGRGLGTILLKETRICLA